MIEQERWRYLDLDQSRLSCEVLKIYIGIPSSHSAAPIEFIAGAFEQFKKITNCKCIGPDVSCKFFEIGYKPVRFANPDIS